MSVGQHRWVAGKWGLGMARALSFWEQKAQHLAFFRTSLVTAPVAAIAINGHENPSNIFFMVISLLQDYSSRRDWLAELLALSESR